MLALLPKTQESSIQKDGLICIGHLSMFVKKVTINCIMTFVTGQGSKIDISYGLTNIKSKTKLIFNGTIIDLQRSATTKNN